LIFVVNLQIIIFGNISYEQEDNSVSIELILYNKKPNVKEAVDYFKFWFDSTNYKIIEDEERQTEYYFFSTPFKIDYFKFELKIFEPNMSRLIKKSVFE
jgi:hypothetical protein